MLTQLINARILTPQGWLKDGSVLIRDGKILEVTNCDLAVIGAQLIDVKRNVCTARRCRNPCTWRWRTRFYGMYRRRFPRCGPNPHEIRNYQHIPYSVLFYRTDD